MFSAAGLPSAPGSLAAPGTGSSPYSSSPSLPLPPDRQPLAALRTFCAETGTRRSPKRPILAITTQNRVRIALWHWPRTAVWHAETGTQ
ncbi:exported hypothetical protein [Cupriavidus taiwanensis]|nr:exported hypothetical protein [Cupriavidus taiwanensis]